MIAMVIAMPDIDTKVLTQKIRLAEDDSSE
jgi:hypothetical protein